MLERNRQVVLGGGAFSAKQDGRDERIPHIGHDQADLIAPQPGVGGLDLAPGDERAPALLAPDETFRLQLGERLADGPARNAELDAQVRFGGQA